MLTRLTGTMLLSAALAGCNMIDDVLAPAPGRGIVFRSPDPAPGQGRLIAECVDRERHPERLDMTHTTPPWQFHVPEFDDACAVAAPERVRLEAGISPATPDR